MSSVTSAKTKPPHLLLVEDNTADAKLLLSLFEIEGFGGTVDWVKDGEEALRYLFRQPPYANAPKPDLVILDLNLPKVHGRDLLKSIRQSDETRHLPVIVMTTSSSDVDMMASYEWNAKSFLTKPKDLEEYEQLVKRIITVDLSLATIKNGSRPLV